MPLIDPDRRAARRELIAKVIALLKSIDTEKINAFVKWATDLLAMIGPVLGLADEWSQDDEKQVAEAFAGGEFQALALDLAAIIALVKLIIQIFSALKGKPAETPAT
jgi:hypothetical protein